MKNLIDTVERKRYNIIGILYYKLRNGEYIYGTTFEYYAKMREVFHYDDGGFFGNQKTAVYCPIYLKDFEGYPWYEWQK